MQAFLCSLARSSATSSLLSLVASGRVVKKSRSGKTRPHLAGSGADTVQGAMSTITSISILTMQIGLRNTALKGWESFRMFLSLSLQRIQALVQFLLKRDQHAQSKSQPSAESAVPQAQPKATSQHYQYEFPLTEDQRQQRRDDFVSSLDKQVISGLASQSHNNQPCNIIQTKSGSYNISFIVEFLDGEQRVVRIPINPLLSDVQSKINSEIATMLYVRRHTSIPISKVYKYDRCDTLSSKREPCWFMILEYIPGESLNLQDLRGRSTAEQDQLFSALDSILCELWQLKFSAPGSLLSYNEHTDETAIGSLQSVVENDLQVDTGRPGSNSSHLTSTADTVCYLYNVVRDFFTVPCENSMHKTLQREVFAVHELHDLMHTAFKSSESQDSFSLNHMDLRCENIIVTDDLHIVGIIDWEWAMILPSQLCVNPFWLDEVRGKFDSISPVNFSDRHAAELVAHALLDPRLLIEIYFYYFFPMHHDELFSDVAGVFFQDPNQQWLLQAKWNTSVKYTEFLKSNNLFIQDEAYEEYRQWTKNIDDNM